MRKHSLLAVMTAGALLAGCGAEKDNAAAAELTLDTTEKKVSYIFGLNIARNMQQQEITLDPDAIAQAIKDVYSETEPRISEEDQRTTMEAFQSEQQAKMVAMQAKQQEERAAMGEKNKAEGEAFLAANKDKEGVVTLDSGLQYKEVKAGEGPKPGANDTVTVHYRGTLIDGTEFDSSYARNEPATFPLQNVIPGWTEGLQQMSEGGTYELYIPSDLAYGPGGSGPTIGPNSTLIFQIELLKAKADAE